jgi:hypothetical protein
MAWQNLQILMEDSFSKDSGGTDTLSSIFPEPFGIYEFSVINLKLIIKTLEYKKPISLFKENKQSYL